MLIALQFLTSIPIKIDHFSEKKMANSLIYFPIIGAFIGLILFGINSALLSLSMPKLSVDIITIAALTILTGAIHLDGVADSFDALASGKNKEEMLRIMREPTIGAIGTIAIINVTLLKIALLYACPNQIKLPALILMCAFSRWAMVFLMFMFPYARAEGKAKIFTEKINLKIFFIATSITLLISFTAGFKGLVILPIIAIFTYSIGKFIVKKINGITGDTIGMVSEIIELLSLFAIYLLSQNLNL